MSHAVHIVCRPTIAAGFALAGLAAVSAANAVQALRELSRLSERHDVGIVLMEDLLYEALPEEVLRGLDRRALPLVVPFPSPRWEAGVAGAEQAIANLFRRAIGYRIRLQ